jgi:hypothetical protein
MATPSDPPVRGSAATREPGKPETFAITVLGRTTNVPTEDKDLQITVTSARAKFTLPLQKDNWSFTIERI